MKAYSKKRIEEFIQAVMKIAQGDFSVQVNITEQYDELDALAMGFNMMTDDLREKYFLKKENENIKQLNRELIIAKNKAEESDRLKSSFLANMSHEIRTPMNGILGFTELLKKPNLSPEKQRDYIRIIEESGARLLSLIDNIINMSKIEAGQQDVHLSKIKINEKMAFVHDSLKLDAEKKNLSLIMILPENDITIETDVEKFIGVLINLVKNAIKYTDQGEISFSYEQKGNMLEFYVKDTGIGIPENKQRDIFERFIQADMTDRAARHGAGLGLSIAKAYVEILGGKIWVKSNKTVGSTFYFTLPLYSKEPDQTLSLFSEDIYSPR